MKRAVIIAAVILTSVLSSARVHAQATGQINGIVTDSSGGVLPGVTIEAVSTATGATRTAVSGTDGLYTIPLIPPGNYTVKASLQGFRTAQRDGVRVTVTETARVPFQLEVGQLSETITVSAEATLVETSNATHGIVIDEQKVVDLPLNGRNFTQLGTLIPVWWRRRRTRRQGGVPRRRVGNATRFTQRNRTSPTIPMDADEHDTFHTASCCARRRCDGRFKILTHAFSAD